ncbi:TPR repeat [Erythrobacter litoralis]|uniref:Uncharacterized protein n=1 Tax=Erythrobacter litoralis TaxID=39960 RepID=A0A074MKC0_9SPHN|nr:tetratricopeptide repeat protein [Erythrobacter litoralis]AOL22500.1 TPR repeat [Erythrobacter litoralis]KEO92318.1 hypothetical protein EH32_00820 [Erythrobacter litoralis]
MPIAAFAAALLCALGAFVPGSPAAAQGRAEPWNALSIDDITQVSTKRLTTCILEQATVEDLRKATERGDACAAVFLAYAHKNGLGGLEVDKAKGYGLTRQSCETGDRRGCVSLAFYLFNGKGVAADVPRAMQMFEGACCEGIAFICIRVANFHAQGTNGIRKSPSMAQRFRVEGCVGNYPIACRYAGDGLRRGEGVPKSYEGAPPFYRLGCDGGDDVSCFYAAATLVETRSKSDPSIYPEVSRFYQTGCERRVGAACYNLGSWFIDGRAGRTDGRRAIELLGPLCLRDKDPDIQACNNAGTAAYRGTGMNTPDYDAARTYYEQACYLGALIDSCRTLSDIFGDRQITPSYAGEREWLNAQLCFKAAAGDYCDARTDQHRVYRLARKGSYGEAQIVSANLCARGDGLGCKFQEVLLAYKNEAEARGVCRKLFS